MDRKQTLKIRILDELRDSGGEKTVRRHGNDELTRVLLDELVCEGFVEIAAEDPEWRTYRLTSRAHGSP